MSTITTRTVLSQIWSDLLIEMLARVDGVIADTDVEELHKFRVALRKTRALLKLFEKSLPDIQYFATEFRWLSAMTGSVRDLDVLLQHARDEVPTSLNVAPATMAPIIHELNNQRNSAHTSLRKVLASVRWKKLVGSWQSFVANDLSVLQPPPALLVPVRVLAKAILLKNCIALLKNGAALDADTPSSVLHKMRIRGKRTRYLLDTMQPFIRKRSRSALSKKLVRLQDVLGAHQDAVAARDKLRAIDKKLARSPNSSAARKALQQWLELLEAEQNAARTKLPEALKKFSAACDVLI